MVIDQLASLGKLGVAVTARLPTVATQVVGTDESRHGLPLVRDDILAMLEFAAAAAQERELPVVGGS